jgi:hypothetical protein
VIAVLDFVTGGTTSATSTGWASGIALVSVRVIVPVCS